MSLFPKQYRITTIYRDSTLDYIALTLDLHVIYIIFALDLHGIYTRSLIESNVEMNEDIQTWPVLMTRPCEMAEETW